MWLFIVLLYLFADNLDLKKVFGKKKRKRKKKKVKEAFNIEALPDAMHKTKEDKPTIERGENKEAIEVYTLFVIHKSLFQFVLK